MPMLCRIWDCNVKFGTVTQLHTYEVDRPLSASHSPVGSSSIVLRLVPGSRCTLPGFVRRSLGRTSTQTAYALL